MKLKTRIFDLIFNRKIVYFAISVGYAIPGLAVPTHYPNMSYFTQVRNNTNSSLLYDSVHSNRVYVLPPNYAEANVTGLNQATTNIGFCKELAAIQKYNLDALEQIKKLQDRKIQVMLDDKETDQKIRDAQAELAKYVTANHLSELQALDKQIEAVDAKLKELYQNAKDCTGACDLIHKDIAKNQSDRAKLLELRLELSSSFLSAANEYEKRKLILQQLENERELIVKKINTLQAEIRAMYADYVKFYDVHAQREGGRVAIDYTSLWTDNLKQLQKDNPNIAFEKMQTVKSNVKIDAYSRVNTLPGASILNFELAGQSAGTALDFSSFPERFAANAVVNLLSACPIFFPTMFGFPSEDPATKIRNAKFGLIVNYQYPAEFRYNVDMSYNLYHVYEAIKKQGSSGGLFNSRSWSDQQEREVLKEGFTVNWLLQSPDIVITEDQKRGIEADMRKRMLSQLSARLIQDPNSAPKMDATPEVPKQGSVLISNALMTKCPTSKCQAAGLAIDILGAIFNSSEATQTLKRELNVNLTERYFNAGVIYQPRITSFQ
jgi:hypothetical protein